MSRVKNIKTEVSYVTVDGEQHQRRIDNFLTSYCKGLPRARIYQMVRRGEIRVNGGRVKQGYRLQQGDRVRIPPYTSAEKSELLPPGEQLLDMMQDCVLFNNDDLIVLNKPAGMVVHGGTGRSYGVIELLRYLYPRETGLQLVHRLDQDTSGCLLIARNARMLKVLHSAMTSGEVKKTYKALLKGQLSESVIEVNQPLKRNYLRSGERMVQVDNHGKQSKTRFEVEKLYPAATLVKVSLMTGRTHQIRVHAGYLDHPVAGDTKYGDREFNKFMRKAGLRRMFLHASDIVVPVVSGLETTGFTAPLPDDLRDLIDYLDRKAR
jgi:23S rRNA pseudouridine955/2504/2580 synthase